MVFPTSAYTDSAEVAKNSTSDNKPSWAFDANKSLPRTATSLQDSYRIPFPQPPDELNEEKIPFLCTRIFLITVNSIFFVIGFIMVIMAIVAAGKPAACASCYAMLRPLLITGMLMTFISSIGLFGAVFNSYKMLLIYVTCVTFLLMIQMIFFFWPLFGRNNFRRRLHTYLTNMMRTRPHDLVALLEIVQSRHECCGVNGPLDYHLAGLQVPRSCCSKSKGLDCSDGEFSSTVSTALNSTTLEIISSTESANATSNITMGQEMAPNPVGSQLKISGNIRQKRHFGSPHAHMTSYVVVEGNHTVTRIPLVELLGPRYNFSTNGSLNGSIISTIPPALFNDTNVTGGLEHWDLHHVKMRGCYHEVWRQWEKCHALLVGITLGAALFLGLQLTILCLSHGVARGGFIEQS